MKLDFRDWRKMLKLWAPALIGISAMLLLASLFEVARYFLFMHHLFWMFGIILLINPVSETISPSADQGARDRPTPRPSTKAQIRAEARRARAKSKPWPATEAPSERLARLQREKEAVDRKFGHLTNKQ